MISVPVPTHISGVDGTICDAGRGLSSGRSIFSLRQQLPSEDKWTGHWMALLGEPKKYETEETVQYILPS